jgi:hypothetical protein
MFACLTSTARADLEIEFSGLDLVYDGSSLYDGGSSSGGFADPADADPLTSMHIFADGSLAGSLTSDISADIFIPDVLLIPAGPGTFYHEATPGNPGFFDLLIGTSPLASEFLLVDLESVDIAYLDSAGLAQFTFGAAVSSTFAQNLPFGLEIGEPITVSFSAQVDPASLTQDGGFITGFEADGTGEVGGVLIPEPATALLLLTGAMAGFRRRTR